MKKIFEGFRDKIKKNIQMMNKSISTTELYCHHIELMKIESEIIRRRNLLSNPELMQLLIMIKNVNNTMIDNMKTIGDK